MFTYVHLRKLTKQMPSFRSVSYQPSLAGPAGGLVTLSRRPVTRSAYRRFTASAAQVAGLPRFTRPKALLKGMLVSRLAQSGPCIVNTHPIANTDGDWSDSSRFFALHQGQLATIARIVSTIPVPCVVCGDFNVARESTLYRNFMSESELADAFGGRCPPTFRREYLPQGRSPQCIDFILVTSSIKVAAADMILTGKQQLPSGPAYVSDHTGLRASLLCA